MSYVIISIKRNLSFELSSFKIFFILLQICHSVKTLWILFNSLFQLRKLDVVGYIANVCIFSWYLFIDRTFGHPPFTNNIFLPMIVNKIVYSKGGHSMRNNVNLLIKFVSLNINREDGPAPGSTWKKVATNTKNKVR